MSAMFSLAAKRVFTPHTRHASPRPLSYRPFIHVNSTRSHRTTAMTVDESTQTNGVAEPGAGQLNARTVEQSSTWTVQTVLADIEHGYAESTDSPVPFFHLLERLKTTKRAGWRRFGIDNCESISDHMYRMSILTMLAPASVSSKLDILRCTRMALIHDMAESLVGDITPVDPVSKEEKSRRESETMDYICTNLLGKFNGGLNGAEMRKIWQEYEDSETAESLFVHDIDKVELLLQMVEYERSQKCETDLGEFTWVAQKITSPEVKTWANAVFRERQELWRKAGKTCSWRADTEPKDEA